jgi:ubiquinone/menaquinone biosynthesis C-methylase UbiE
MKLRKLASSVLARVAPTRWKEYHELDYWKNRVKDEGNLSNTHYRYFYTTHFGLDDTFYTGKFVLDVGCGPRGSLEWASMTARRVGVDPLAQEYLKLGAHRHNMEYIDAPSEHIPRPDGQCDVVCSFNSLDHVSSVEQTIEEIKRLTRKGGLFLLLVEVNHPPTACEPHHLSPRMLLDLLSPEFNCETSRVYRPVANGIYESIHRNQLMSNSEQEEAVGYLSARFRRV